MGWHCNTCGEGTESDALNFIMLHDPAHDVQPAVRTAARWVGLLGSQEA